MDLARYERLVASERAAKRFLRARAKVAAPFHCPRCGHGKSYVLADARLRCALCRYTYHEFTGRFLDEGNLSPRQWLRLAKLFELAVPAATMATQLGLAYNTAYKAATAIRKAIAARALDAPDLFAAVARLANPKQDGGRCCPSPVFGLMEKKGWVFCDLIPGLDPETVLLYKLNFRLKTAREGSIVYTAPAQGYDALFYCVSARGNAREARHADKVAVDASRGFWPAFKSRLESLRGITAAKFPLYVKEFEFRYNHRSVDQFSLIVDYLVSPRPDFARDDPLPSALPRLSANDGPPPEGPDGLLGAGPLRTVSSSR